MVLVGDAFDTRPFRLPWPEGTVLFCVAPAAAHAAADAAFKAAGARVPRGCLLRRVPAELAGGASFAGALETAGFRGDRLSVWALQVGGRPTGQQMRDGGMMQAAGYGMRRCCWCSAAYAAWK